MAENKLNILTYPFRDFIAGEIIFRTRDKHGLPSPRLRRFATAITTGTGLVGAGAGIAITDILSQHYLIAPEPPLYPTVLIPFLLAGMYIGLSLTAQGLEGRRFRKRED